MCLRLSLVSPGALLPHSVRIVQEKPKARVVNTERWNQVCACVVLAPSTLDKVLVWACTGPENAPEIFNMGFSVFCNNQSCHHPVVTPRAQKLRLEEKQMEAHLTDNIAIPGTMAAHGYAFALTY